MKKFLFLSLFIVNNAFALTMNQTLNMVSNYIPTKEVDPIVHIGAYGLAIDPILLSTNVHCAVFNSSGNKIKRSSDGNNYTLVTSPPSTGIPTAVFKVGSVSSMGANRFIAKTETGGNRYYYHSYDCDTWTQIVSLPTAFNATGTIELNGNTYLYGINGGNCIAYAGAVGSPTLTTIPSCTGSITGGFKVGNSNFLVSSNGHLVKFPTPSSLTAVTSLIPNASNIGSVVTAGSYTLISGTNTLTSTPYFFSTLDGVTFKSFERYANDPIISDGSNFISFGFSSNYLMVSTNGQQWKSVNSLGFTNMLLTDEGGFVVYGSNLIARIPRVR